MAAMHFISCVRFSMQLMMGEGAFATQWQRRNHFWLRILSGLAGYLLASFLVFHVLSALPWDNPAIVVIYYGSLFSLSLVLLKYCFAEKFEELLFGGVCGYATQHIAFALITIVTELTGVSFSPVWDFILIRFLPYFSTAAIVYFGIVRRNKGKGELKRRDIRMVWLACAILFTVIFISVLVDSSMFRGNSGLLQNVFCKVYAVVCSLLAIFIAYYMSRQNRILHEKEIMENMLHNLSEQQKISQETINIINIKCHDLKYRISKISRIEDAEDQKEYIESVKNAISIYDNIFQTGNKALDLVLTEKSILCNEYNIKLSCMVDGKLLDFMKSADVYAMFGNLMDNAIESVMKEEDEEKRIISICVSRKNGGSYIHMENYCKEEVIFKDGLPVTTKKDTDYHGFGTRSIKYIVEKYKGTLLMRGGKNKFFTDILFYTDANPI